MRLTRAQEDVLGMVGRNPGWEPVHGGLIRTVRALESRGLVTRQNVGYYITSTGREAMGWDVRFLPRARED